MPQQTAKHYIDYYSDWSLSLMKANRLLDMVDVVNKADRFIGIITELKDADRITTKLAAMYVTEVNQLTAKKHNQFLN